jgi:hypothetical protein
MALDPAQAAELGEGWVEESPDEVVSRSRSPNDAPDRRASLRCSGVQYVSTA